MRKKIINIMFIIDHLYGGGGGGTERHLFNLTKKINRDRFNPVIVAFDTGDTPLVRNIKKHGTDIIHVPVGRYYTPHALKKTLKLTKLIESMKIDVVQTYHIKSDTLGVLAAKCAGVKHIISSKRDVGDQKKQIHFFLNRRINRFVDGVIVVADKVGEVVTLQENIDPKKIKTIYNGVDIDQFKPADPNEKNNARKHIGLDDDDFVIGMVAVFRPEKNHDVFFNALKQVSTTIKNIKAVVVGDGPLFGFYQEYCKCNGLENRVVFVGGVENVKQYLQTLDVACLVPGSNEGFSNSIIEKMSMGLPLVVSDIGGNAEAVIDGFNGFVVPPNQSIAVAEAILKLYNDASQRRLMGMNSRIRVEKEFSLQKMVDNYEKYYEKMLAR